MRVGIVGHGSIGSRHATNARILGHDVIVYDPAGPRDVAFERKIYADADAIVIANPSFMHEGSLRAAIERRKPVLVEKPISVSLGMLDLLLSTAEDNGVFVMMGNNLRFHPCVQETKARLGEIGDSIWASFTCASLTEKKPYLSDGVTLSTGSHEVDLALYFFGPGRVIASSGRWGVDADEIIDFVVLHDNGVRSSFHLDFVTKNEIREYWIAGSEHNIGAVLPQRLFSLGDGITRHKGSYDDDYLEEMRMFLAAAETPGARGDWATGRDGFETLKILLGAKVKAAFPS